MKTFGITVGVLLLRAASGIFFAFGEYDSKKFAAHPGGFWGTVGILCYVPFCC